MQPSERADFLRVLNGLAAIKRVALTAEAIDLWWATMRGWSLADFKAGAEQLLRSCQFMPTPYDFAQLRKASAMTAGEAWEQAIAACGGWRNGTAAVDPLTDRVVRMVGGYERLAMEPLDTQHFTRNKFIELYDELAETETTRKAVPQIAGPPTTPRLTAGTFKSLGWQPGQISRETETQ